MVRRRTESILLNVDFDGIEVPACLRPPGDGRACYHVRWKLHGRWHVKSTGTTVLEEAKRIGRGIVRGEHVVRPCDEGRLSVERFVEIQKEHYESRPVPEKGAKTFTKFLGAWNSFRRDFPDFKFIQEVSRDMALRYVRKYHKSRRDRNFAYETKSEANVKPGTVDGHVRSLRAAWNRVRLGHTHAKAGLHESEMVTRNPWEEVYNEVPKGPRKEIVQFDLSRNELDALLDNFRDREIATLFLIVSFWANGRIEAMSHVSWSWIDDHGYIDIPDAIAKNETGKVVRIPLMLLSRLEAIKVRGSDFVFGGFAKELRTFYQRNPRKAHHANMVLDFSPDRMKALMQKHIHKWCKATGLIGRTEMAPV